VSDTTTTSSTPVLERRLGPFDAAAIIIANVIGGGILFRSPAVAAALPDATWFLLAWLAGGVLAFMGAMAYAELAALRPKAGGEYVYLREAFGPLAGFLTGWTSFVRRLQRRDGRERHLPDRDPESFHSRYCR
jgi:APA family basic amino acid/polyamine antiporter